MQDSQTAAPQPASRRGFFFGAATAAPELPPPPAKGGGYSLSEHVKRYYKTTSA